MELGQMATAMITPFTEKGEVDYNAIPVLINHLLSTGTQSLIVNGTTAESPTLSHEEKEHVLKVVLECVDKRVPVIAGTGSNDTQLSIEATGKAELLGADGIMAVVPYYNKPDQQGMYAHFKSIAESTTLPVMVYNIPSRSGVNMTSKTVIQLSKINNIRAVKEASGNLVQISEIIAGTDESFAVYSGDDILTLPLLAIGGHGVISVSSHIVGLEMQQMIQAFRSGNYSSAAEWHHILLPFFQAVFSHPNPVPIKYYANKEGLCKGNVRLPLVDIKETNSYLDETYQRMKEAAKRLKE